MYAWRERIEDAVKTYVQKDVSLEWNNISDYDLAREILFTNEIEGYSAYLVEDWNDAFWDYCLICGNPQNVFLVSPFGIVSNDGYSCYYAGEGCMQRLPHEGTSSDYLREYAPMRFMVLLLADETEVEGLPPYIPMKRYTSVTAEDDQPFIDFKPANDASVEESLEVFNFDLYSVSVDSNNQYGVITDWDHVNYLCNIPVNEDWVRFVKCKLNIQN